MTVLTVSINAPKTHHRYLHLRRGRDRPDRRRHQHLQPTRRPTARRTQRCHQPRRGRQHPRRHHPPLQPRDCHRLRHQNLRPVRRTRRNNRHHPEPDRLPKRLDRPHPQPDMDGCTLVLPRQRHLHVPRHQHRATPQPGITQPLHLRRQQPHKIYRPNRTLRVQRQWRHGRIPRHRPGMRGRCARYFNIPTHTISPTGSRRGPDPANRR